MALIREIVQQALATGYLTLTSQEQLRQLLQTTKYTQEDINAFITLQKAAMDGHVKQEFRELRPIHFLYFLKSSGNPPTQSNFPQHLSPTGRDCKPRTSGWLE